MRRDLRSLAAAHAVALALSATACGSAPAAVGPKPTPPYTPSGTLLLDLGGFEQRLVRFEFPRGPVKDIIRNSGGGRFFGFRFGAAWGDDGFVYSLVSVNFGLVPDVQLYRTNPGGASREMGRVLHGGGGFAFRGHFALTWTCAIRGGQVYVMDVAAEHAEWTPIATGCEASLSPDLRTVAFVDKGVIWTVPIAGGSPERLLELRSVGQLPGLGIVAIRPNLAATEFGRDGVAVTLGAQQRGWAIVVARRGHRPEVIPLGSNEPRGAEWQPGGSLLAFADFVAQSQATELRLFDPETGRVSQMAATLNYGGFRWSPDGAVMAVQRNASVLAFIDPVAGQVGTVPVAGAPDDWVA